MTTDRTHERSPDDCETARLPIPDTNTPDRELIAELRGLLEKATPGPYDLPHFCDPESRCQCRYVFAEGQGHMGAIFTMDVGDGFDGPTLEDARADAKFVVAAINSLPTLLDALAAERAGADVLKSRLEDRETAAQNCAEVLLAERAKTEALSSMLWSWFEERGDFNGEERSEGLTADDFRTMLDEHETALLSRAEAVEKERDGLKAWVHDDERDMWSEFIEAAHPSHSDDPKAHERFGTAMQMVRTRRSKFALVALIHWLLTARDSLFERQEDLHRRAQKAESRADRAEAEVAALRARVSEVLEPFLRPVKDIMPHWPDDDYATLEALVLDPLTIGDFRRAAELHAALTGERK